MISLFSNRISGFAVTTTDDWSDELLELLAGFYCAKEPDAPWSGRWDCSTDYFAWKCRDNPVRPSLVSLARDAEGGIAAAVIITFKRLSDGTRRFLVGELGDLFVRADCRRRGLFSALVAAATAAAHESGVDLVYCIPNADGGAALTRAGTYAVAHEVTHATWVFFARPLAVAALKLPWLSNVGVIDRAVLALGRLVYRRAVHLSREVDPATYPDLESTKSDSDDIVLDGAEGYLAYRVLQYPQLGAYRVAVGTKQAGAKDGTFIIFRRAGYKGLPVVFGAKLGSSRATDFSASLELLVDITMKERAVFCALWAPRHGRQAAVLFRHGFLPTQKKQIVIAHGASSDALAALPKLRLDMLDSDKI